MGKVGAEEEMIVLKTALHTQPTPQLFEIGDPPYLSKFCG